MPAFLVVGGPTVVIDLEGLRFLTDPTFDPPSEHGPLRKLEGPAVPAALLEPVDVVLVSHAAHADNLDRAGREVAGRAPLVLTTSGAAAELGPAAVGLAPWERRRVAPDVEVVAVPGQHGPADGEPGPDGEINCAVTGFVLRGAGRSVYVSGDNASLALVQQIRERLGPVEHAVLFAGRAIVPAKFGGRPLSLSAERAAAAAEVLGARHVVVAHQTGWAHFTQGPAETERAFADAGLSAVLDRTPPGRWSRPGRDRWS